MIKCSKPPVLAALVIALAVSGMSRAGNITNGGFETGDFSGWTLGGACSPFTIDGPCWSSVDAAGVYGVFAGSHIGRFGSQPTASTLMQMVTVPTGPYTLSFEVAVTTSAVPGDGIFNPANFIDVAWNGGLAASLTNLTAGGWRIEQVPIVSDGTPGALQFTFRQDITGDFYIDNISLDAGGATNSTTPEPATLWMFGLGLTAIAALSTRRQARALAANRRRRDSR